MRIYWTGIVLIVILLTVAGGALLAADPEQREGQKSNVSTDLNKDLNAKSVTPTPTVEGLEKTKVTRATTIGDGEVGTPLKRRGRQPRLEETGLRTVTNPEPDEDEEKIEICHKPDSPAEKTLLVGESSVADHLAHGDVMGPCGSVTPTAP